MARSVFGTVRSTPSHIANTIRLEVTFRMIAKEQNAVVDFETRPD